MSTKQNQQPNPICPQCGCKHTVKKGKRRNRLQVHQVFKCTECLHRFTGAPAKNKTYPLRLILETISTFNLGYSLTETQRLLHTRFHRNIPERTISSWLTEYRPLATYSRLRTGGKKLFAPETIIRTINFDHQQVYRHQVHRVKLKMLLESPLHNAFTPLTKYLEGLETNFPNHFFQAAQHRSSKFPAELRPPITRKENHATRTAALALPTAPNNKKRHETLQRFMLVNDSVSRVGLSLLTPLHQRAPVGTRPGPSSFKLYATSRHCAHHGSALPGIRVGSVPATAPIRNVGVEVLDCTHLVSFSRRR